MLNKIGILNLQGCKCAKESDGSNNNIIFWLVDNEYSEDTIINFIDLLELPPDQINKQNMTVLMNACNANMFNVVKHIVNKYGDKCLPELSNIP